MTTKTFADLGVDDRLVQKLRDQGIEHPFPIQELALPMALKGADVIGQARTGTGKTLAFGLPLLMGIDPDLDQTQALVITPTRELCLQVAGDLEIGSAIGVGVQTVYGGVGYEEQIEALTSGVHVVVGTPGRTLDHLGRGNLDLTGIRELVLDEADEMLDMGFLPDVERLIEACADDRHTMLFSATMPTEIVKLARRYMSHPTFLRADVEEHEVAPTVEQHFFLVHRMDKPRILARILQQPERGSVYVFTRTKRMADRLVGELDDLGVSAIAIHGDKRQATRERNMDKFRDGKADVLVATEVAARGLDVDNATHVINYDCPDDEKMYLHRIGRTARAGAGGVAVTFAEFDKVDRLNVIRRAVDAEREIEEVFSTSDLLTERFDLPAETPWDHLGAEDSSGSGNGRSKRRSSSDGTSKNRSSAERSRAGSRKRSGGGSRNGGDGDGTPMSEQEPAVVKTRSRSRSKSSRRGSPKKSGSGGSSSSEGGSSSSQERPKGGARAPSRRKKKGRRSRSRASGEDSSASGSSASEPGGSRSRSGSSGSSGKKSSSGSSGKGSSKRRSGRKGGRDASGGGKGRSSGGDTATGKPRQNYQRRATEPIAPTASGTEARGGGSPTLARRVKVEHLP